MKSIVLPLVFALLIVGSGIVHGIFTERWNVSADVEEAVGRLQSIPLEFGDWVGEPTTLDAEELDQVGIRGYFLTRYRNKRTGMMFTTLIVGGRNGPISVHTPDICYTGAGYTPIGGKEMRSLPVGSEQEKFWVLRVRKPSILNNNELEIYWVWNRGKGWEAPNNPRVGLATPSTLFKLYVIRDVSPQLLENQSPLSDFLSEFLPRTNQVLFSPEV
jgi:hypothetical protein